MADSTIRTGDLKNITNSIIKDTDKIRDLHTYTITQALEQCQENLVLSGLNYEEVNTTFKTLFTTLTDQLKELTDAMNTKILPRYEMTATSITKLFNQDLANEMNDYLKIINGK